MKKWPTTPHEQMRTGNLVEILSDPRDSGFDQPCHFGYRVEGHAVYCHNDSWTEGPRKCRNTWYTGGRIRDEDCYGFMPNERDTSSS